MLLGANVEDVMLGREFVVEEGAAVREEIALDDHLGMESGGFLNLLEQVEMPMISPSRVLAEAGATTERRVTALVMWQDELTKVQRGRGRIQRLHELDINVIHTDAKKSILLCQFLGQC